MKPDQPNAARHAELRTTWRQGQKWETLVENSRIWCVVGGGGFTEPTWDEHQEYRQAQPSIHAQCEHCGQPRREHGFVSHLNECPEIRA